MASPQDNASGLVLPFHEPLQLLQAKPFDYSLISKQGGGGGGSAVIATAVRSEFLAELAYHRNAVSAWLSYAATGFGASGARAQVPDAVLQDLTSLAARLHGLAIALTVEPAATGSTTSGTAGGTLAAASLVRAAVLTSGLIRTEWTSALSNKPQRMLRLDSLPQELAMVYTATAAALRQSALQRVHEHLAPAGPGTEQRNEGSGGGGGGVGVGSIGGSEDAGGAASGSTSGIGSTLSAGGDVGGALTSAVGVLRKAAGLYGYLAEVLLPDVVGAGNSNGGDRPLELLPAAARLMRSLCLGEAQALVAAAAVGKGLSYGTQRALHAGCVALFQQAEGALHDLKTAAPPGLPPSDRLGRLVALYGSLHAALSYRAVAAERQKALELGEAEAACEECGRLLSTALRRLDRSDPPFWSTVFNTHQTALAPLQSEVNKDRLSVTYQPLPQQPQDATANPATRVTEDSFAPAPVMPQAPPVEEAGKGGCCIG